MRSNVLVERARECQEWQALHDLCTEITGRFDAIDIPSPLTASVAMEILERIDEIVVALHDPVPFPLLSLFRTEMSQLHELLTDSAGNGDIAGRKDTRIRILSHLEIARLFWGRFEGHCASRVDQLSNFSQ